MNGFPSQSLTVASLKCVADHSHYWRCALCKEWYNKQQATSQIPVVSINEKKSLNGMKSSLQFCTVQFTTTVKDVRDHFPTLCIKVESELYSKVQWYSSFAKRLELRSFVAVGLYHFTILSLYAKKKRGKWPPRRIFIHKFRYSCIHVLICLNEMKQKIGQFISLKTLASSCAASRLNRSERMREKRKEVCSV